MYVHVYNTSRWERIFNIEINDKVFRFRCCVWPDQQQIQIVCLKFQQFSTAVYSGGEFNHLI